VAQTGKVVLVTTDAATQLRAALAQNAALNLSLDISKYAFGSRVDAIIRSLQIVSAENLAWELWFYRKNTYDAGVADAVRWCGYWQFGTTAVRIGAAGYYYYYIDGLGIPYIDEDNSSKLHFSLINRSAAAKSANDAGLIKVGAVLEPALGW
jgi:hypothetical protein